METEIDPYSDPKPTPVPRADRGKQYVLRAGWIIMAIGLLIAVVGAAQRAQSGDVHGEVGRTVHHTGMAVMLLGLFVVLLAHRVRWFLEMTKMNQPTAEPTPDDVVAKEFPNDGSAAAGMQTRHVAARPPQITARRPVAISLGMLFGVVLFCTFSLVVVLFAPNNLAGAFLNLFVPAMTVGMIVVIVYGTSLQRTFTIGALVPWTTIVLLHLTVLVSLLGSGRGGRSYRYGRSVTAWLVAQSGDLFRALEMYGQMMRLPLIITITIALLSGLFAVVVRMVLCGVNADSGSSPDSP